MVEGLEKVSDVVTHKAGRIYKKPVFEKCEGMTFPTDVMEIYNGGKYCIQCSGCHGCR